MSYGESQEDQLKMIFRTQELQRRQARQRIMLNHIELAKEPLSPEELLLKSKNNFTGLR